MIEKYYQVCSEGEVVYDNLPSLIEAKKRLKELKEFDTTHHINGLHYTIEEVVEKDTSISSSTVLRDSQKISKYKITTKDSLILNKLIKDEESEDLDSDPDFDEEEEISEDSNKTCREVLKEALKSMKKTDFRYYFIKILLGDSEAKSWGYLRDPGELEGDEYDVVSPKNAKKIYKTISRDSKFNPDIRYAEYEYNIYYQDPHTDWDYDKEIRSLKKDIKKYNCKLVSWKPTHNGGPDNISVVLSGTEENIKTMMSDMLGLSKEDIVWVDTRGIKNNYDQDREENQPQNIESIRKERLKKIKQDIKTLFGNHIISIKTHRSSWSDTEISINIINGLYDFQNILLVYSFDGNEEYYICEYFNKDYSEDIPAKSLPGTVDFSKVLKFIEYIVRLK